MKALLFFTVLSCLAAGCERLTPTQEAGVRHGSGVVGTVFGLPPVVGESIGGVLVAVLGLFAGHKHGRRCERKKQKACNP